MKIKKKTTIKLFLNTHTQISSELRSLSKSVMVPHPEDHRDDVRTSLATPERRELLSLIFIKSWDKFETLDKSSVEESVRN